MNKINYAIHPGLKAHPENTPSHIAIIMDGNGRWAGAKGLSRTTGHRQGLSVARDIITACQEKAIKALTLFAFGVENWKRPTKEVRNLFRIFFLALRKDIFRLHKNNIKLRIIGDKQIFNRTLMMAINEAQNLTQHNTGLILNIAVNYSGRWDLIQSMQNIVRNMEPSQDLAAQICEEKITKALSLNGLPEPDLFIRTGGVKRISNFILWELAYTELYFTNTLWPDFTVQELEQALVDYSTRERRFGLTAEQLG